MPLNLKKEADLLEQVLSIAETDYAQAYRFLLDAYEKSPAAYGPQTLYFLACLSGGTGLSEAALGWLKKAVLENGWWYRPEVLIDDDLETLSGNPEFLSLKAVSDARYQKARETSKAVFSRKSKTAANLFLAVHGNTQNADLAREDWAPVLAGSACWQLETVQSAEPDGCGTYRWSYDMASFLPVAGALEALQTEGYETMVCGGFSAGTCCCAPFASPRRAAMCWSCKARGFRFCRSIRTRWCGHSGKSTLRCGFSAVWRMKTACRLQGSSIPRQRMPVFL